MNNPIFCDEEAGIWLYHADCIDFMDNLIKEYPQGMFDLIFDPFAGSFTTGVAAINTNRRFIGVEKDMAYINLSIDRLTYAINKKDVKKGGEKWENGMSSMKRSI